MLVAQLKTPITSPTDLVQSRYPVFLCPMNNNVSFRQLPAVPMNIIELSHMPKEGTNKQHCDL